MKLKRIIASVLVVAVLMSLAACGKKNEENIVEKEQVEDVLNQEVENQEDEGIEEDNEENSSTLKPTKKPTEAPTQKPTEAPTQKPTEAPTQKPVEEPKTVGEKLLVTFNQKAGSLSSSEAIANEILSNPVLGFQGATMPVEPGLLSGFDNAEIKGFKEATMFLPMIGSIPFIGYVFILEDGTDASGFIANLKANANLRWNICTEAEEMVTGRSGNKVFFVMCPKSFEEE